MFAFVVSLITVLDFFERRESLSVQECSSFSNTLKSKYLLPPPPPPGCWLRSPLQRYGRLRRLSSLQPNASRNLPEEAIRWLQPTSSCDVGAGKDQQGSFYGAGFNEHCLFPHVSCWKGFCHLPRWTSHPLFNMI